MTSGRSTVGTVTEINDYLRVLWARAGRLVCPDCEEAVTRDTPESVWRGLNKEHPRGTAVLVCYPQQVPAGGVDLFKIWDHLVVTVVFGIFG